MAKDKKSGKKSAKKAEAVELIAGPQPVKASKKKKKDVSDKHHGGLETLAKLAEHPLVGDLLAVGALAAVAAIAESGKADPAAVKSANAVKSAGKAAAAAIGARLLKEFAAADASKQNAKA
ncbi:hypothetical protein ACFQPG_11405 [Sphingomonas sp. GCM10030256]|uniref:hypothetical protein n=1 Tax=Sphingomonas sp. GCM10030256 TaxID=3273427 RepID=UPI00361D0884